LPIFAIFLPKIGSNAVALHRLWVGGTRISRVLGSGPLRYLNIPFKPFEPTGKPLGFWSNGKVLKGLCVIWSPLTKWNLIIWN